MKPHKVTAENVASLVVEETLASCIDYQQSKRLKVQLTMDPVNGHHTVRFDVYTNGDHMCKTPSLQEAVETYNAIEV